METKHTKVLRIAAVMDRVGLRRTSIYDYIKKGNFPPPIRIGEKAVAWREADIERWISEREVA